MRILRKIRDNFWIIALSIVSFTLSLSFASPISKSIQTYAEEGFRGTFNVDSGNQLVYSPGPSDTYEFDHITMQSLFCVDDTTYTLSLQIWGVETQSVELQESGTLEFRSARFDSSYAQSSYKGMLFGICDAISADQISFLVTVEPEGGSGSDPTSQGEWTYNSSGRRFDYVYGGETYEGTLVESTSVDYDYRLSLPEKSFGLVTFSVNIDGTPLTETFTITNASVTVEYPTDQILDGKWYNNASQQEVSVSIYCGQSFTHEITMKTGHNYMDGMNKIIYVDSDKVSWIASNLTATYSDSDDSYVVQYFLENEDTGETGDSGDFTLTDVVINSFDQTSTSGYMSGKSEELFGSTTVELYVVSISTPSYTVTLMPGQNGQGDSIQVFAYRNVPYSVPGYPFTENEGYHFTNWVDLDSSNIATYQPGDVISVTQALTLTAGYSVNIESLEITQEGTPVNEISVEVGYSITLEAMFEPSSSTPNLQWWSGSESVATVTQIGEYAVEVHGVAEGQVNIVVQDTISELMASCALVVTNSSSTDPTQESGWSYTEGLLTYYSGEFGPTTFEYHSEAGGSQVPYCIGNTAVVETYDGQNQATISFSFYNENNEEVPVENATLVLTDAGYSKVDQNLYSVTGTCEGLTDEPLTILVQSVETSSPDDPTTEQYRYNITFDGNGYTGGSMSNVEFYSDNTSVDYELPECSFEREDYAFFAWSHSEDGLITIKPHETIKIDYSVDGKTFFAIWGRTITFNSNGGDGYMEPLVVKEGYNEVPSCDFTRDGYAFKYWAVGSPTGIEVNAGSRVNVDGNYVLYAVWQPNNGAIEIEEDEVVVYVGEEYLMQYKILPEGYEASIFATVEQGRVAEVYVEGEIFIYGLSAGTTKVTLSDESGSLTKSFTLYVVEPPEPVEPENKIEEQTIIEINNELADASLGLSSEQIEQISGFIDNNKDYISDDAGSIVSQALGNTTIDSSKDYADAQKSLVVTVVETGLMVDAGKATSLSGAQEIDKALPSDANFSVESEIDEFYQRQMVELFGGQMPSRRVVRAETPVREIDIDPKGREGTEAIEYLGSEETLYKKMVGFVDNSVDHMGKAALKIRKCSGESVVVQVKSYVTVVKVSSFRDFDKEAADKEFVEAAYKAIMLSMQNEVISILEKEHEPSNNAEKEAQYQKELDAVKDYETFEIMVTEVLRQKWVALTGDETYMATAEDKDQNRDSLDIFHDRVFWPLFEAWALDAGIPKSLKDKGFNITLEELTKTTIEQSTNRARTFTVHSDLSTNEWVFIGAIAGGAAIIIAAAAVIPTLLKKKKAKEGIN